MKTLITKHHLKTFVSLLISYEELPTTTLESKLEFMFLINVPKVFHPST